MKKNEKLFSDFPPITKMEWLEKLTKDLKGRATEELNWQVNEKITLAPMYHPDDTTPTVSVPRSSNNNWEISEDFVISENTKIVNQQLLAALNGGLEAPRFVIDKTPSLEDWQNILKEVNLTYISTHLYCKNSVEGFNACKSLYQYIKNHYDTQQLKGSINIDYQSLVDKKMFEDYIKFMQENFPQFKYFSIDAIEKCKDAAETPAELLALLTQGKQLLDKCSDLDLDLATISPHIQFAVGINKSYFVQIAKVRALKILWANVLNAYGISNFTCPIEAHFTVSSQGENENTNMIRATTQAMSAVIGGVERLNVLPANSSTTEPNEFTHRIARNVQHLLKMESHLDVVQDPAAGSYYIESLTTQLAQTTWSLFQQE